MDADALLVCKHARASRMLALDMPMHHYCRHGMQ